MSDCVFCRIIKSEIPSYKVYEDDSFLAILDHRPVREGHIMVLPKNHIDHFIDMESEAASRMMCIAHKLGQKIRQELNPPRVGFIVAGFGMPHAHLHVQPLWEEHDVTSARYLDTSKTPPVFDPRVVDVADPKKQEELSKLLFVSEGDM